jgi:hypothetical protein
MTGLKGWKRAEKQRPRSAAIEQHQLDAAASPAIPLKQLAAQKEPQVAGGNFQDVQSLLDQLGSPPVFELGKPLPNERYLPKHGLSSCPAAHNRALLDDERS